MTKQMTIEQFVVWRANRTACSDAEDWIRTLSDPTPYNVWRSCPRGDWLLWWCGKAGISRDLYLPAVFAAADRAVRVHAPRALEAAGLKGTRIGNAEISKVHGNFFVNHGETRAGDVLKLIELTRNTVKQKLGVELELEVELVGEW